MDSGQALDPSSTPEVVDNCSRPDDDVMNAPDYTDTPKDDVNTTDDVLENDTTPDNLQSGIYSDTLRTSEKTIDEMCTDILSNNNFKHTRDQTKPNEEILSESQPRLDSRSVSPSRVWVKSEPSSSPSPPLNTISPNNGNFSISSSNHFLKLHKNESTRPRSRSRSKSGRSSSSPDVTPTSRVSNEKAEQDLVNQLQLPSDVLFLKQAELLVQGTPRVGWLVCSAIPLPPGSSLGPFQGQLVKPDEVKVGDLIVQVCLL